MKFDDDNDDDNGEMEWNRQNAKAKWLFVLYLLIELQMNFCRDKMSVCACLFVEFIYSHNEWMWMKNAFTSSLSSIFSVFVVW